MRRTDRDGTMSGARPVRRLGVAAWAAVAAIGLTGCGLAASAGRATWHGAAGTGDRPGPLSLALVAPAKGAQNVPTSAEIGLKLINARSTVVELVGPDGKAVPGFFRLDGQSWVPARQLAYDAAYQVRVSSTGLDGTTRTATSSFRTMQRTGQTTGAGLYVEPGEVVGVGMPIVVEFNRAVKNRAAVQRRMFVFSTPPVEGTWHWFNNKEAHFRPREYWPAGTRIQVRLAIGGFPFGDGWYGLRDRTANVTVGPKIVMDIDNRTKQMTVIRDGIVVRRMPISLGKRSTPTFSGNMVVMDRQEQAVFDSSTYGVPANSPGGYRITAYWTMRFTWSGQFIHAAPWSVGDQGRRNVSHGCVNVSTGNARWLFGLAHKGDPVIVRGTERAVEKGNGWTDWSMTWEQYKAGSALA